MLSELFENVVTKFVQDNLEAMMRVEIQFLGDHDTDYNTTGGNVYGLTIMSYARKRQTMHTPQSHDLADLYALRNS